MGKLVLFIVSLFVAFPGKKAGQMVSIITGQLSPLILKPRVIGANQNTQFYAGTNLITEKTADIKKPP